MAASVLEVDEDAALAEAFWQATTPARLNLILMPTEQCNFRCTYCYEDFLLRKMTPTVVGSVTRLLTRRAEDLQQLQLSWFGGEPTLALDVIEQVSDCVHDLTAEHTSMSYDADMTTNGYRLTPPMMERLLGWGVTSFEVTLDGPASFHDRTRLRADGRSTFARIWTNLLALRDSDLGFHVTLRVHLTPENLDAMPGFIPQVRDTFLDDDRFGLLLMPVAHLGGPRDHEFAVLPHESTRRTLRALTALAQGRSATEDASQPLPKAQMSGMDVCYASKANSLVIRSDGRVGKCTVALSEPRNDIGVLRPDGTLSINNERLRHWLQGWGDRNWDGLACPRDAYQDPEERVVSLPMPTVRS